MATYAPVIRKGMLRAPIARYRGYPGGLTYQEGLSRSLSSYAGYGLTASEIAAIAKAQDQQRGSRLRSSGVAGGMILTILAASVLSTFVVVPWVAKFVKPGWTYGQRVIAGMVFTAGIGAIRRVGRD